MQEPAASAAASPDIVVLSGSPTESELAAATVVLRSVLAEIALENETRGHAGMSAWARSQRSLRGSGIASWRSFSA